MPHKEISQEKCTCVTGTGSWDLPPLGQQCEEMSQNLEGTRSRERPTVGPKLFWLISKNCSYKNWATNISQRCMVEPVPHLIEEVRLAYNLTENLEFWQYSFSLSILTWDSEEM